MTEQPQLHTSIVSMISLAAGIAAKHPDMGLCQLERLRAMGIPEHQLQAVIEIARHIRDEATEKLDHAFNKKSSVQTGDSNAPSAEPVQGVEIEPRPEVCCTPTTSGQSCC